MARHEAFYVEAAVLGEYTTNAFLVDDARDDVLLLGSLRGGFASVVAERFSVVAELSAIAARYNRFSELSYDRLGGTLSAAVPLRGWQVGVAYEPSVIFDDGFDERQLTQHQFTLFADRQGRLPRRPRLVPRRPRVTHLRRPRRLRRLARLRHRRGLLAAPARPRPPGRAPDPVPALRRLLRGTHQRNAAGPEPHALPRPALPARRAGRPGALAALHPQREQPRPARLRRRSRHAVADPHAFASKPPPGRSGFHAVGGISKAGVTRRTRRAAKGGEIPSLTYMAGDTDASAGLIPLPPGGVRGGRVVR